MRLSSSTGVAPSPAVAIVDKAAYDLIGLAVWVKEVFDRRNEAYSGHSSIDITKDDNFIALLSHAAIRQVFEAVSHVELSVQGRVEAQDFLNAVRDLGRPRIIDAKYDTAGVTMADITPQDLIQCFNVVLGLAEIALQAKIAGIDDRVVCSLASILYEGCDIVCFLSSVYHAGPKREANIDSNLVLKESKVYGALQQVKALFMAFIYQELAEESQRAPFVRGIAAARAAIREYADAAAGGLSH